MGRPARKTKIDERTVSDWVAVDDRKAWEDYREYVKDLRERYLTPEEYQRLVQRFVDRSGI